MNEVQDSGASEKEAVRTTIVGGRPPGSGKDHGSIPRGIEVLLKKAAVDRDFRALLLERRAGAAEAIDLPLTPVEKSLIGSIPAPILEKTIDHTRVPSKQRPALLGKVARVMLAALTLSPLGCPDAGATRGISPDEPPPSYREREPKEVTLGHFGDMPEPRDSLDVTPEPPRDEPAPTGIRPDLPPPRPDEGAERPSTPGESD